MRAKISSAIFRIALVFVFIATVDCRNGFLSQLREARKPIQIQELRQKNTIRERQKLPQCKPCISAIEQKIQSEGKSSTTCHCYSKDCDELIQLMPDQCQVLDNNDFDACLYEMVDSLNENCEEGSDESGNSDGSSECKQCISALEQNIRTDDELCNSYENKNWEELDKLIPDQCHAVGENDDCATSIVQSLVGNCQEGSDSSSLSYSEITGDKRLEQAFGIGTSTTLSLMCEMTDCRFPMAQILCKDCFSKRNRCDDPDTMVACLDGTCITTDGVCNGLNTCSNPKNWKRTEDEFGCPKM